MLRYHRMSYPQSICVQLSLNDHYDCPGKQQIDNIEPVDNFDFGSSLLSTYDVLEQILEYLPYCDLKSLSKLSPNWSNRVDDYLKKRLMPHIFYFSQHPSPLCKKVGDNRAIKPLCTLTFFNDNKIKLHYYVCMHQGSISSIFKKPVVQFIEENILTNEKCPVLALSCKQSECSVPSGLFFNGIVLPCIPSVNVSIIRISKLNKCPISTLLDDKIGADNVVNCLLAFTYPLKKNVVSSKMLPFIKAIKSRQPSENFALGGGLVTGVKSFNVVDLSRTKRTDDVVFVAFNTPKSEDVQFDTYSLKITEKMIDENEVENFFIDFKKYFKKRKHSVALRFSCSSLDDNVASVMETFLKYFPDTGISGFSCNGEIGWNKYKEETHDEPSRKKIKILEDSYVNYFTIIFVILSWGKII